LVSCAEKNLATLRGSSAPLCLFNQRGPWLMKATGELNSQLSKKTDFVKSTKLTNMHADITFKNFFSRKRFRTVSASAQDSQVNKFYANNQNLTYKSRLALSDTPQIKNMITIFFCEKIDGYAKTFKSALNNNEL
jgi:hypothetical protein